MKKKITFIFFTAIIASLLTISCFATSGSCGDGVNYSYSTSTNILIIYGSGTMNDFYFTGNVIKTDMTTYETIIDTNIPWYNYAAGIKRVVVKKGVNNIGNHAFSDIIVETYYENLRVTYDSLESIEIEAEDINVNQNSYNRGIRINFNSKIPCFNEHSYSNICDNTCDVCFEQRIPPHSYTNSCDTVCDVCGEERVIAHTYSNSCDTKCDECGNIRIINHTYSEICDETCEVCNFKRNVTHTYTNNCDRDCNICLDIRDITHHYTDVCDIDCNVCGNIRNAEHNFGEFISDNNATVDADGTKTRVCSVCGDKETVKDIGSKLPTPTPTPEIKDTASMFNDIKADAWYKQYVDYAVTHGIFNGTTDTTFAPSMTMTRAQFVQVLANISGVDTTDKNVETVFSDVPSGRWFTPAVKWAFNSGVVTGSGGGKFSPNANITREDMCLMLVRYAKYKNIELKPTKTITIFADNDKIGKWAIEAVYTCQMAEIVGGKGNNTFEPKATGSRSEAATIFTRFHKNYVA